MPFIYKQRTTPITALIIEDNQDDIKWCKEEIRRAIASIILFQETQCVEPYGYATAKVIKRADELQTSGKNNFIIATDFDKAQSLLEDLATSPEQSIIDLMYLDGNLPGYNHSSFDNGGLFLLDYLLQSSKAWTHEEIERYKDVIAYLQQMPVFYCTGFHKPQHELDALKGRAVSYVDKSKPNGTLFESVRDHYINNGAAIDVLLKNALIATNQFSDSNDGITWIGIIGFKSDNYYLRTTLNAKPLELDVGVEPLRTKIKELRADDKDLTITQRHKTLLKILLEKSFSSPFPNNRVHSDIFIERGVAKDNGGISNVKSKLNKLLKILLADVLTNDDIICHRMIEGELFYYLNVIKPIN